MLDILHSQAIGVKRYLIDYRCISTYAYPGNLPELSQADDALAAEATPMLCPPVASAATPAMPRHAQRQPIR
jgi:hypothetical protein